MMGSKIEVAASMTALGAQYPRWSDPRSRVNFAPLLNGAIPAARQLGLPYSSHRLVGHVHAGAGRRCCGGSHAVISADRSSCLKNSI